MVFSILLYILIVMCITSIIFIVKSRKDTFTDIITHQIYPISTNSNIYELEDTSDLPDTTDSYNHSIEI